jgi:hypothetical protein
MYKNLIILAVLTVSIANSNVSAKLETENFNIQNSLQSTSNFSMINSDDAPLVPLSEVEVLSLMFDNMQIASLFPKTLWNECTEKNFQGNYVGLNCTKREIANIFLAFLDNNFKECASRGADSRGLTLRDFKVIHKGLMADGKHSSRSLHSYFRAIDIKDVLVTNERGQTFQFNYEKHGRGRFYSEFRACWGRKVVEQNDCPPHSKGLHNTASIGKDDDPNNNHHQHLHVSLPYCINNNYAGNLFTR